ncbi:hypothetical protein AA0120_g8884 [Alternaria tenuissima]|nr:hypothetical protein AA0120_g8884 [Alternaria tenuissima]
MDAYAYRALEGQEYIRLLVLHPALSKTTPLRIDFVSSKLEDVEGDYDAVSYTWGKPVLTFPLYVGEDGMQVYVTENLDRALRYLRYETRERMLWADAACINQKDNEEKATQIPLMVQIFRGARRVMAWLDPCDGEDTTVEQRGMRLLDRISRLSTIRADGIHEEFFTVMEFFLLPWFNRLWIIQEVVFNLEVCLICGETELPLSQLVSAVDITGWQISWTEPDHEATWNAVLEIGRLWNLYSLVPGRKTFEDRGGAQIVRLMEKFRLYECTDPRDRIFALCSMANDVILNGNSGELNGSYLKYFSTSTEDDVIRIDIDYSLDVRETYEAFALACLMGKENANLIWKALLMRQHSPPPIDWPSWVPDWRVQPRRPERGGFTTYEHERFDCNSCKIATGILRVSIPVTRSILEGKEKQLYTINFKISKETKDPQMPFDSQLSQLYQMLQMPETVQGSHQLPIKSASTSRKRNPINFPNLSVHIIMANAALYDSSGLERGEETYSKLEHYLARMSTEPNLRGSSESSSHYVQGLIEELEQKLCDKNTLFCFRDPGTGINSGGYGSVALELGDSLLPLCSSHRILNGGHLRTEHMLIIRPVYTIEALDGEKQMYRLVGDAFIFDPTTVLVGLEFKKQRGETQQTDSPSSKEEFEAISSSVGCQEFDQVVYLA